MGPKPLPGHAVDDPMRRVARALRPLRRALASPTVSVPPASVGAAGLRVGHPT